MRISVVIPCYRSSATLPTLLPRLHRELQQIASDYEIILVVDGSPDDTYAVARSLEVHSPEHVRAVLLRRNYGQHNALLAGIVRARFEITVTMDDDLQHLPEELPKVLAPLADPAVDMVYAVAAEEEHGVFRSLASRLVKSSLALSGVPSARDVSAYRAFRTDLREGFAHVADAFASLDVLISWTTTAVRSVEVEMAQRETGTSGYSFRRLIKHALNMITGYGTAPLTLVTWLGLACSGAGVLLLFVVLWKYYAGEIEVAGFTTVTAMLAILSGVLMLSIGILGEYIGRLHFRSMQRPAYVVRVESDPAGPRAGIVGGPGVPHVVETDPDAIAAALRRGDDVRQLPPSHEAS